MDMDMMADNAPSCAKKWIVATRPFALPASTTPVLFGTVLASVWSESPLNWLHFLMALFAMVAIHSASNMLNDVYDYRNGLDTQPTPVSGAVVRGYLSPEQVFRGAVLLLVLGVGLGAYLVAKVGWPLLYVGLVGVFIAVFYTARPFTLKYHALGDLAVFLDFGLLGALGAWMVQTGEASLLPVVWTIPIAMLVVGIVHANNWRDLQSDKAAKIHTMAGLLGDKYSLYYYGVLVFGAYLFVVLLVGLGWVIPRSSLAMPPIFLIVFLSFPRGLTLFRRARQRKSPREPLDFLALDGATAQLNLLFGLLCSVAAILHAVVAHL